MDLKTPKDIKALAAACRKAGIISFKGFGVEFSLSAAAQAPKRHKADTTEAPEPDAFEKAVKEAKKASQTKTPEAKTPTEQEMMFWSAGDGPIPNMNEDQGPIS